MPLQNRVQPTGDLIVHPARGLLVGNRGIIHRPDRTLGTARWSHHAWICCVLDWQGRKRTPWTGRKWTELFFLDEAVAMAAGHRPCGYCRRAAYNRFVAAWTGANGTQMKAAAIDKVLHQARVSPRDRTQIRHRAPLTDLPTGAMVMIDEQPHLVGHDTLLPYDHDHYGAPKAKPRRRDVTVLTPQPMIAALRAGFAPQIHPSAGLSQTRLD